MEYSNITYSFWTILDTLRIMFAFARFSRVSYHGYSRSLSTIINDIKRNATVHKQFVSSLGVYVCTSQKHSNCHNVVLLGFTSFP